MEADYHKCPAKHHVLNGVNAALLDPHWTVLLFVKLPDFDLQGFAKWVKFDCKTRRLGALDVKLENEHAVDPSCY